METDLGTGEMPVELPGALTWRNEVGYDIRQGFRKNPFESLLLLNQPSRDSLYFAGHERLSCQVRHLIVK